MKLRFFYFSTNEEWFNVEEMGCLLSPDTSLEIFRAAGHCRPPDCNAFLFDDKNSDRSL